MKQLGEGEAGKPAGLTVRLGGIYALEKLAQEYPDRYHWTVMEVLCSFVRENALAESPPADPSPPEEHKQKEAATQKPTADIQAAVTVIGRRRRVEELEKERRLDLRSVVLPGADLIKANLSDAYLCGAILIGARLRGANLRGAYLYDAKFSGANLSGVDFRDAYLYDANFDYADTLGVYFSGADLSGADLSKANFTPEQLKSAIGSMDTKLPPNSMRPEHWQTSRNHPRRRRRIPIRRQITGTSSPPNPDPPPDRGE